MIDYLIQVRVLGHRSFYSQDPFVSPETIELIQAVSPSRMDYSLEFADGLNGNEII